MRINDIKLAINIAATHLVSKKKQTLVASLGVTFGIGMFILMISFMTGVNDFLEDTMLTSTPHIRIYKDIESERPTVLDEVYPGDEYLTKVHHQKPKEEMLNLKNGLLMVKEIEKMPGVSGVSPQLTSQVFFNYGPVQIPGSIAGVDIGKEDLLYDIKSKMKEGTMDALLSSNDGIIMGAGLARKMNVTVNDKVMVTTPYGTSLQLRIVGLFATGVGAIDNIRSYCNISTAQKILQKDTRYITDVHIKLHDLTQSKEVATRLERQFGYKAEDWETANATILVSFVIRNILTYVVVITLLVVAGFGIYNIMNMTIYDKMKDIAILKAVGFEGSTVVTVFLAQAVFIGLLGGIMGLAIGFLLSFLLSNVPFDGGEFMSVDTFPVAFKSKYYVFGFLFGIFTTLLAGYFPSRKASKIDPVAILRG